MAHEVARHFLFGGECSAREYIVPMTAVSPTQNRWLWGSSRDLLLGCGAWYLLLFPVLALAGPGIRSLQPLYLAPLLIFLISTPHYGATLVRVYEQRGERRAYAFFTVWTTLALIALFVWGVQNAAVGTLLFTAYLTWSPWHYTGQNYGIAVMFMRRRGVDAEAAKRWLHGSFVLSYALTFLVMHQADGNPRDLAEGGVHLARLGIPEWFSGVAIPAVAAAWAVALLVAGRLMLHRGRLRDLLPIALLALSQALWFTVPDLARYMGSSGGLEVFDFDYRALYFNWVVVAHAVQYLWITSFYARSESGGASSRQYLVKTLLAGNLAWFVPALIFAPQIFGGAVSEWTVGLLVASLVNLHHFILDGAIWKLRKSKIADILIRARSQAPKFPAAGRLGTGRFAKVVWGSASVLLAVALAEFAVQQVAIPSLVERGKYDSVSTLLNGLAWVARDSATARAQLGNALMGAGRQEDAARAYARSGDLTPSADTFGVLARIELGLGLEKRALADIERAVEIAPNRLDVLSLAGQIEMKLGHRGRAGSYFRRALGLDPNYEPAQRGLAESDSPSPPDTSF